MRREILGLLLASANHAEKTLVEPLDSLHCSHFNFQPRKGQHHVSASIELFLLMPIKVFPQINKILKNELHDV
ncbi:hypothetical protein Lal_00008002 [Lupinus albus]|nr:hypothetical protein Lal_00008002 [Lupinus albus]